MQQPILDYYHASKVSSYIYTKPDFLHKTNQLSTQEMRKTASDLLEQALLLLKLNIAFHDQQGARGHFLQSTTVAKLNDGIPTVLYNQSRRSPSDTFPSRQQARHI